MLWSLIQFLLYAGLLIALVVGLVRVALRGAWVWRGDEFGALSYVVTAALVAIPDQSDPRHYYLRVIRRRIDPALRSLLVLIGPDEIRGFAPFIESAINAQETPASVRDSLTTFRTRMIRQSRWPQTAGPR
jgi:hypothetical protein